MKFHSKFRVLFACAFATLICLGATFSLDGQVIYSNNFDQHTSGRKYKVADLNAEWNSPEWDDGVSDGRVKIETGYQAYGNSGACLVVKSPQGKYGPGNTGAQWQMMLDDSYEDVVLSYDVKFKRGFDFVRGGKLPGLAGGTAPTGYTQATGYNGWTGRMMWRTYFTGTPGSPKQKSTNMISYSKFVKSGSKNNGKIEDETPFIDNDGSFSTVKSNKWYRITQRVRMNDRWTNNGIMQIWLDDTLVVDQQNIRYRKTNSLGIDQVYFSYFFGGDYDWRTSKYETAYFDNIEVFVIE